MRFTRGIALATAGTAAVAGAGLLATGAAVAAPGGHHTFIGRFHHTNRMASTVRANGDVNPYGVVVVRRSQGRLHRGDILVSNFNNSKNLQGTGSTIVHGWVIVGNLPSKNGQAATSWPGCLFVLDSRGTVRKIFSVTGLTDRGTLLRLAQAGRRPCSPPTS